MFKGIQHVQSILYAFRVSGWHNIRIKKLPFISLTG